MNEITQPDDAKENTTTASCRGRFIVPTADLSARVAYSIAGFFR